MLIVLLACARHPSPPPSFGVSTRLPDGAPFDGTWASSDPRGACAVEGVSFLRHPTAADWPYALPPILTCRQGHHAVTVATAFTPPGTAYWFASDGTGVDRLRGAAGRDQRGMERAVPGLSCSVAEGMLVWDVRAEVAAGGTCWLGLGTVKEQREVLRGRGLWRRGGAVVAPRWRRGGAVVAPRWRSCPGECMRRGVMPG
ncbi:MAG: hypothetical protein V4850_29255 [Myxococcota bacterium]